jgi:hypothetical protein
MPNRDRVFVFISGINPKHIKSICRVSEKSLAQNWSVINRGERGFEIRSFWHQPISNESEFANDLAAKIEKANRAPCELSILIQRKNKIKYFAY